MHMHEDVQLGGVVRSRTTLADPAAAQESEWRVCFRLKPRPGQTWAECFQQVSADCAEQRRPGHSLQLHATFDPSYHYGFYGGGSARTLRRASRRILRALRVPTAPPAMLEISCPPSKVALRVARREAGRLLDATNELYGERVRARLESRRLRQEAFERLGQAVGEIESQRRRNLIARAASQASSLLGLLVAVLDRRS